MPREAERVAFARKKQLFVLLGERKERRRLDRLIAEGGQGGVELPLAAVDQQDVGKDFVLVGEFAVAA